jgi:hypothetical protein
MAFCHILEEKETKGKRRSYDWTLIIGSKYSIWGVAVSREFHQNLVVILKDPRSCSQMNSKA